MPRSGEDARRRLHQAALELIGQHGYDATTAAEIAARAGVTERTFFRHFADKREALFGQEEALRIALTDAVRTAPAGLAPLEVMRRAFGSVEQMLLDNRPLTEPLQKVIAQSPALQERVLTKTAGLIDALAEALRRRGVSDALAALAAQVGMAAFSFAARAWADDPGPGLDAHLARAFDELNALSSTVPNPSAHKSSNRL
jgi:AcrR family transcriptional regulator